MLNVEELHKVLNSVKVLKMNADFSVFMRHISELLEGDRIALENTKPEMIQLVQGRVAAWREIIGMVDGVNEIEKSLEQIVNQGESEQSDP